ncbi:MAG: Hsp20/alpha crystallin family protein [Chromatiales bacterium]|jgi:HSP20 family protein
MSKRSVTGPLIGFGLLALAAAAGAQSYFHYAAAGDSGAPPVADATPVPDAGRLDPWAALHADMMRIREQMDQMLANDFQDFHGMPGTGIVSGGGEVTLHEQGDNYVVKAEIPGVKESDVSVNLDGRLLSISAQTRASEQETGDNGQVISQESYVGAFQRAFTLPGPVSAVGMHSRFKDGVLTVTIPKATS